MKTISITGTKRAAQSKQETIKLRAEGMVPCVLYGGKEQFHFSTPAANLKGLVYSPQVYIVELSIDGKPFKAVMKDVQFHAVTDKLQHIDFMELTDDKKVTLEIMRSNSAGSTRAKSEASLYILNTFSVTRFTTLSVH